MNIDHTDEVRSGAMEKRPRGRALGSRNATREPARDPDRADAVVRGRNGEILSRTRTGVGDRFAITDDMREPGWDLQWNAISVLNNKDVVAQQSLEMFANGWRPVPHDRYPGRYAMPGTTGPIIVDGLQLEERPISLSQQARVEEIRKAKAQLSDQNEALKLSGVTNNAPGFSTSSKYRGAGGDIRMQIDRALYYDDQGNAAAVPAPKHELANLGE